jgi:transcriptional regulator with XRE-family HTH domain
MTETANTGSYTATVTDPEWLAVTGSTGAFCRPHQVVFVSHQIGAQVGVLLSDLTREAGFGTSAALWLVSNIGGIPFRIAVQPKSDPRPAVQPSVPLADDVPTEILFIKSVLGLSVTAMARALHVERPTIYAWMKGTSSPSAGNLERIGQLRAIASKWDGLRPHALPPDLRAETAAGPTLDELLNDRYLRGYQIELEFKRQVSHIPELDSTDQRKPSRRPGDSSPELDILTGRRLGPEE